MRPASGGGRVVQLGAGLDHETPGVCERLDRLQAADVRAGHDALHPVVSEHLDEIARLAEPPLVQGPQAIVAIPFVSLPGGAVPNDEHRLSA